MFTLLAMALTLMSNPIVLNDGPVFGPDSDDPMEFPDGIFPHLT